MQLKSKEFLRSTHFSIVTGVLFLLYKVPEARTGPGLRCSPGVTQMPIRRSAFPGKKTLSPLSEFQEPIMKLLLACLILSLSVAGVVLAKDQTNDVTVTDGVIRFFPAEPENGVIARCQIADQELWVGAARRDSKTRQVRIHSRQGGRGTSSKITFFYPFGTDSATWNMDIVREGDVVTATIPWNATLLGERMDVNEGSEAADAARDRLGVLGPVSENLPVIYSSGDSISLGYWPYLEGELWEEANVYYQRELWKDISEASSSNNGHAHLAHASLLKAYENEAFQPDYLMINFGLHMIATYQNKQEEYADWVQKFEELANTQNTQLVWVNTTPYGSFRTPQNVIIGQFNALVSSIAEENGTPVIDLHAFVTEVVEELGEENVYTDGVHFTEEIKERQAEFIANRIREIRKTLAD
jgi:lysophospholipase L1-like esterase